VGGVRSRVVTSRPDKFTQPLLFANPSQRRLVQGKNFFFMMDDGGVDVTAGAERPDSFTEMNVTTATLSQKRQTRRMLVGQGPGHPGHTKVRRALSLIDQNFLDCDQVRV
jgi:hypothetical protein